MSDKPKAKAFRCGPEGEKTQAVKRLNDAAPALLAACKSVKAAVECLVYPDADVQMIAKAINETLTRAIAKTEGKDGEE